MDEDRDGGPELWTDERDAAIVLDRLQRLQRVGVRLAAARAIDDVVTIVLDEVTEAVDADAALVAFLEPDNRTIRVLATRGFSDGEATRWATFPVDAQVPIAHAVRTGETVLLRSEEEVLAAYPSLEEDATGRGYALGALPLTADGVVFGAVGLAFHGTRIFDDGEADFLESLSLQCAAAFDRSRAYEGEAAARAVAEAARARLAFLAEATTVLSSSLDWERTLATVAELAVPALADWCEVHLLDEGRPKVVKVAHRDSAKRALAEGLRRHHRPHLDAPLGVGAVINTGVGMLVADAAAVLRPELGYSPSHLADLRELGIRSAVTVPLRSGPQVLGALSLVTSAARVLDDDDLALAGELATRASQAISNAQLYRERAHVARTLQSTLLPPSLPAIAGLEVASRFVAAGDGVVVGGDFYDVFPTGPSNDEAWHIVIGDVRGKGVEAAALTGVARNTIRSAAIRESSPAALLGHLNAVLIRSDEQEAPGSDGDPRFCTVVLGTLSPLPRGFCVELAVAGHPLPFVLRADGTTEQVGTSGTLLGIVPDPTLADVHVELEPGDALVLYTDGVTERHADDRFFEEEGLAKVLSRCSGFTAATLAERIETAARGFVEDELRDDLAVLVVRVPSRPAATTSATTDLPAHPMSARRARRFVITALEAFGVSELGDVAELLTSEVVTNAVVHAHSGVRVALESLEEGIRVSVSDSNALVPSAGRPVDDADRGRGLHLVDLLADRWGVEPSPSGKTVWFELRRHLPDPR